LAKAHFTKSGNRFSDKNARQIKERISEKWEPVFGFKMRGKSKNCTPIGGAGATIHFGIAQ